VRGDVWLVLAALLSCGSSCAAEDAGSEVLLRHGSVVVTRADYEAELQRVPAENRAEFQMSEKRVRDLLAQLFVSKSLAREARQLGLAQDPLVQRESELAVDRVLASARLDHLIRDAKLPDFEPLAGEQYRADPQAFEAPVQVRVSHILISTQGRSEEAARQRAEQVRVQAVGVKKPFSALAAEYSDDPSVKKNHGDLGLIAPGKTVKPFEDAAFALKKPGDISPVVKTPYGFEIIRLEERRPARKRSFEEVKPELVKKLRDEWITRLTREHVDEIRSAEDIYVNQEAISALKIPMPELPKPSR
jgi:peptidyl-prolyl cis-trans isomerase C